jgi:gliding motility-associated-like protein
VVPIASASFNTTVISQGLPQLVGFANTSINANSFYWTLGNGNTSVMQTPANQYYNVAGTYTVTLIAYGSNGCNDTISTTLAVIDTVGLTVPNIFTPNGDEINDVWQPSAHGATSFECVIFNRWGIKVYEFLSAQDKWDGHTTAGVACNEGTYYYILKATDSSNKSYNLKGYIQLIR